MVPTEVLAQQHFQTFRELFENTDVNIQMLSASLSGKDRKTILEGLKNKTVDIVVGTHSLSERTLFLRNSAWSSPTKSTVSA